MGLPDSFGVPGLGPAGPAGPDLRSQGSSGKDRLSRCARGRALIASSARSGPIPLPPVLPEVTDVPPIIASQTMNPSQPRSGAWIGKLRRSHFRKSIFVPCSLSRRDQWLGLNMNESIDRLAVTCSMSSTCVFGITT